MSVLVTGGAGYIGSHTCLELLKAGFDILVADNFCNSSPVSLKRVEKITGKKAPYITIDLCDEAATEALFAAHPEIDSVIHFAGLKAVGESCKLPLLYYGNNLGSTISLLKAMEKHGVKNFVFSSSATVYGQAEVMPIREDFPTSATNPYGYTKLSIEHILTDCCKADPKLNVALLRYFNPIGAHPSGEIGEDPKGIPNNLVPYIARVAVGKLDRLHVFGNDYPTPDGTGVRDYIHVVDLAKGHIAALRKLQTNPGLITVNLGTGRGYSVLEVVQAYEKACGKEIPYTIEERRSGDIAVCYADPTKAEKELGWKAEYGIAEMCRDSWNFQSKNPDGYPAQVL